MDATKKISLPFSLPTSSLNNDHLLLPSHVRTSITTALFTNSPSIPAIQNTLSDALTSSGWTEQLEAYILETFRSNPGIGETEVLERVMRDLRAGLRKSKQQEATEVEKGETKKPELRAPGTKALDEGIRAVAAELASLCEVVDEEEWSE